MAKPAYIEAYPRFRIFDVLRAFKGGRRLCQFWDQRGCLLGDAWIYADGGDAIQLSFSVHGPYFNGGAENVAFRTGKARNRHGGIRKWTCDGCSKLTSVLVFDGCWYCRSCHHLAYRKQFLTPAVIAFERRGVLRQQIGAGRRKQLRNETYFELQGELDELEAQLGERVPQVACVEHSHLVHTKWLKLDDLVDDPICDGAVDALSESAQRDHGLHAAAPPPEEPVVPTCEPFIDPPFDYDSL